MKNLFTTLFLLLPFTLFSIIINAQTSSKDEKKANGLFEYLELLSNKKNMNEDIYFKTIREIVREGGDRDRVKDFFVRSKADTSTVYLNFNEIYNLYNCAVSLLSLGTHFQRSAYHEIQRIRMIKHLVANDYDSIYGYSLYFFDEIRQFPSNEMLFFIDDEMEIHTKAISYYQTDIKGLIDVALSCMEHGLAFPLFEDIDSYSGVNSSEYGWFGDDETILSFYENIYKKYDYIENEKWELLSPNVILLLHVSNPFLSEATFKYLVDMMSNNEKELFLQAVFAPDRSFSYDEVSYKFYQMLFKYFPTAPKYAGYNKLHLAIVNLDVIGVQNIILGDDKTLLQELGSSRSWEEFYREDSTPVFYTPLQLSEYKLSEFEKALLIEQQIAVKSKYTDNELFYSFRVKQMKKILSLLKQ